MMCTILVYHQPFLSVDGKARFLPADKNTDMAELQNVN